MIILNYVDTHAHTDRLTGALHCTDRQIASSTDRRTDRRSNHGSGGARSGALESDFPSVTL